MTRIIEGDFSARDARYTIIAARFNAFIVESLVEGAIDTLKRHGVSDDNITVIRVPGAFEIPLVAQKAAADPECDAVITLGAVIRGATAHFDYVCGPCASGVESVARESGKPVIFGVLTTDTIEQAIERAGTKAGNKGADCALGAMEMVNLLPKI